MSEPIQPTSNQHSTEIVQFLADCRLLIAHSRTFYEVRDALSKAVALIERSTSPVETTDRQSAREDLSYYYGARQAAAMAHQSLTAMDKWIAEGCGNRYLPALAALNGSSQETSPPHPGPSIVEAFARSPRRVDPPGSYRDATGELVLPSENGGTDGGN